MRLTVLVRAGLLLLPALAPSMAAAADPVGYHPYVPERTGVRTVDMSDAAIAARRVEPRTQNRSELAQLDRIARGELAADPDGRGEKLPLPEGMVQRSGMVLPQAIDDGSLQVEPETIFAVSDIPGNEYPRKHTLYLNFIGAELTNGTDNSAQNKSSLARNGAYPAWTQGMTKAVAVAQGVQNDFAPFGINVVYEERPAEVIPYTMSMMGGEWEDTNIDSPAGGVAPGADCGALGQRHVVYAFDSGSTVQLANTASQEAGHAYGLDHTFNCSSVMSYCSGGDGSFQTECAGLCESMCQGPNSAGCQLTHEMFCGEGSLEQNDFDEMSWIFGGNEPDMEAPTVEIVEPADGLEIDAGSSVDFRATVGDNYGGYAWKFVFYKDGEVALDEIDYDRSDIDPEYRVAKNLSNLDAGVYELHLEVHDHFGHMTEDMVTVYVGGATTTTSVDPSTSDGGGTADTSGGGEGEGTEDEGDTTAASVGMDDDASKGCNCDAGGRSGGGALGALGLLGVLGLAAPRRRR